MPVTTSIVGQTAFCAKAKEELLLMRAEANNDSED